VFSIAGYSRFRRPAIILFRPAFIFQSWLENKHCFPNLRIDPVNKLSEIVKIFSQINISVILQSQIIPKHLHVDYNPLNGMLVLISSLKLSTVP
jgi:hypothetical protein